jgi:CDP-diacylglycerol--serine O-phosphatidyltransferase
MKSNKETSEKTHGGMQMDQPHKQKSMFRSFVPADIITLGNAGLGMTSILLCINRCTTPVLLEGSSFFWTVFLFLPAALVCDILDGFVARQCGHLSPLGADLDSLADVVSFGVAPAVLGFTLGLRSPLDGLILIYFVVCGISRLARFNVTAASLADESGKVRYYEGTPIPTSIAIVVVFGVAYWQGSVDDHILLGLVGSGPWSIHPLSFLYAISGTAMVSTIHIPKP